MAPANRLHAPAGKAANKTFVSTNTREPAMALLSQLEWCGHLVLDEHVAELVEVES
jgi:hypothetical protein